MKKLNKNKPSIKIAETETDIRKRNDRVGKYLQSYLNEFVFDEFSDVFLQKSGIKELMKGVPIPLRKSDVEKFQGGNGLKTLHIAENMAWIIGINPKFKYTEHYIAFLLSLYNHKIFQGILKKGRDAAEKEDLDSACVLFRACLCLKPDYLDAMYSYARVCREMYLKGGTEDYVGNLKAESIDYFELLTEIHPDFAQAYYYLGYAYLNLGLYVKAELTWKDFIEKTRNSKDKKEINERLQQLEAPVKIESGCNDVMAGRYEDGISKLEPYVKSQFNTWWPLYYYLGVAYSRVEEKEEAIKCLKEVLKLKPSQIEPMEELVMIYKELGDKDNETKYNKKIDLIKSQMAKS